MSVQVKGTLFNIYYMEKKTKYVCMHEISLYDNISYMEWKTM